MDTKRFEEDSKILLASEEAAKRGKGRWVSRLVFLIIVGGLAYGGYRWWLLAKPAAADATASQPADAGGGGKKGGRGGRGGGGGGRAAVVTVAARKTNMPVYLRGLGTAAAFNIVTVRSRVDGQLMHVAFKEGQFVQQGDLLAEIDKRPFEVQLAQAKGQLARDQALLLSAKKEQERDQSAVDRGLMPKQTLDLQTASVGQYEGAIQTDQAAIDNANLQITYSRIPAPISGVVGLRIVDEGNIVRAADPSGIVVITQIQPVSVFFPIPEDNLGDVLKKVHAGQQLRVEAWDHDDVKKIAEGVLVTADNQIDVTTGTAKLKAVFDNQSNALYPNQFVNVRLLVDTLKDAVVIPGATIQRGTQGTFVYVVKENQTAELRVVTIKLTEGSDVAIASGLEAGEMVVQEGMDKVQDGAKVDVQTPSGDPVGGRRGGRGGRSGGNNTGKGENGVGGGGQGGKGERGRGKRNGA
jgi:membrane fusion protein, multidrug efflux system